MPVLDLFGRPMQSVSKTELLERQAVASLGSVRQIHAGHPADGLTPVRLTALLRAAEIGDATAYLELAEQMEEKDLHYSAVLGVRKRAIRSLDLHVEPGNETAAAQDLAEMTRSVLNSSAIRTTLIDMMDAIGKGYSVCEVVWAQEGRSLTIADLELVDPRWFEFDKENGRHLYLRDNAGPQPLRPDSYVIHMAKSKSGRRARASCVLGVPLQELHHQGLVDLLRGLWPSAPPGPLRQRRDAAGPSDAAARGQADRRRYGGHHPQKHGGGDHQRRCGGVGKALRRHGTLVG